MVPRSAKKKCRRPGYDQDGERRAVDRLGVNRGRNHPHRRRRDVVYHEVRAREEDLFERIVHERVNAFAQTNSPALVQEYYSRDA